jgi:hypothetical protein
MRLVVLVATALVVAAPAAASSITANLTTSTRAPFAGEPWRYTVTVREDGQAIAARMRLYVLRGSRVVRCARDGTLARCSDAARADVIAFRGRRGGVLRWPAALVGSRLTFQASVTTGSTSIRLRAPVTVRRRG